MATPLPELVEALNACRPEGLVGYPTVAGELAAFAGLPDVRQYQVLHDRHGLHVRVILAGDASAATPERLRQALVEAIDAAGAVPPPVEVTQVDALEREPGPAAKFKLVRSTLPSGRAVPVG